ncbi:MAG: lytic murein transglycosylase B [Sedimenticolaceae bacterium]
MKKQLTTLLITSVLLSSAALANTDEQAFIDKMVKEHQFDAAEISSLLNQAKKQQSIIDAMSRPAEKRLNWGQYRKIFITDKRIKGGMKFWKENQAILEQAEKTYGVPAQIITAIVGVETYYGRITGKYSVLDSLYTLGFHYPPRAKFFRSELEEFLQLAREEGVSPTEPLGSYAGAMGRPQFISSSFRAYAVDFDKDGKRDIWENNADVIGSVANYFKRHGWKAGEPVAQLVTGAKKGFDEEIKAGYKPSLDVKSLIDKGIILGSSLDKDAKVALLEMESDDGNEYWVTSPNFYAITRYNHSPLYAMAVFQLSEAIRQRMGR